MPFISLCLDLSLLGFSLSLFLFVSFSFSFSFSPSLFFFYLFLFLMHLTHTHTQKKTHANCIGPGGSGPVARQARGGEAEQPKDLAPTRADIGSGVGFRV